MSRRARSADPERERDGARSGGRGRRAVSGLWRDLAIVVAAFAAAVGIAELAGAANLGVAFGIGQIVFAIVLIALLTRG